MMKILLITLSIFSFLHGELPKDCVHIADEKEFIEMTRGQNSSEIAWLLMPESESFENKVIQKMAATERWKALRAWQPLTFDGYLQIVSEEGLTILHQEPHRIFLKGPALREWLESELAPRLGVNFWEWKDFADEFLSIYGHDTAIRRELLVQLIYLE